MRLQGVRLPPFERVVAEHGTAVLRVCRAVLGPDAAEDAWSETFLSALRAYPDLPPGSNVQAWLVTIAHRKALDQIRAAARRPVPVEHLADLADPAAASAHGSAGSHGIPTASTESADLWAALAALPAKQRATVAYHHLAGLPYDEVARIVGGTPAAARRAAADGIATLRRTYPQGETDDG